jgi:hypothetical protein
VRIRASLIARNALKGNNFNEILMKNLNINKKKTFKLLLTLGLEIKHSQQLTQLLQAFNRFSQTFTGNFL